MAQTTGWPPSLLMQDDCKGLSKWLAKRACTICWRCKAKEEQQTRVPHPDPELRFKDTDRTRVQY